LATASAQVCVPLGHSSLITTVFRERKPQPNQLGNCMGQVKRD